MKTVIGFIVLAGVTLSTAQYSKCPVHLQRTRKLQQFIGSCYEFNIDKNLIWRYAEADCREKKGRLVDIHSKAEQDFIIRTSKTLRTHLASSNEGLWLGLNDISSEGKWSWSKGKTEIDFHNWAPFQPGNASNAKDEEDCGLMDSSGEWQAYRCHYLNGWICEFSLVTDNDCPKRLARTFNLLQWRDNCYLFNFDTLVDDWDVAESNCKGDGGNLVDIRSQEEQDFIYQTIWEFITLQPSYDVGMWIGLTHDPNEGQWNWISNRKQLDYNNWYPGQPGRSGDRKKCALMSLTDSGKWLVYPCSHSEESYPHGWICKFRRQVSKRIQLFFSAFKRSGKYTVMNRSTNFNYSKYSHTQ